MICYIFDTGVVLRTLLPSAFPSPSGEAELIKHRIDQYVMTQWVDNKASLIIPNFIVSEVLRNFAKIFCFDEKQGINQRVSKYAEAKKYFIRSIKYAPIFDDHNHRKHDQINKFINYELNRHHILNLDKIFEFDYRTTPISKPLRKCDKITALFRGICRFTPCGFENAGRKVCHPYPDAQ